MDKFDYIGAVEKHGSKRAAHRAYVAEHGDIAWTTFRNRLKKQEQVKAFNRLGLRIKDSEQAIHPDLALSGISQMVRTEDGIMWVKTNKDHQNQIDRFAAIGESVLAEIKPRPTVGKTFTRSYKQMLSCYVLSDYHLGMFSDHDKARWDTKTAKDALYAWMDKAIESSMDSHTGVFLQLGDFFHANDSKGVTPRSGHVLDIDISWEDVISIGVEALEYGLERMLEKHDHVHFICAEANHDPDAAKWLQRWFERLYRDNPRLTVDCTKGGFYAYQWGKTSLFAHHGHARNINNVSKTLVAMYPEIYGQTLHRYCHLGHFHHAKRKPMGDDGLMDVRIHQTLAAKDQYAQTHGYVASRGASTLFYHREYGYVGEFNLTPAMLL